MLTKHERYHDSGMDALVIVCSRNTNGIMIWANVMRGIRSISGPPNRKTRCVAYTVFRGNRMLTKHERYYDLGKRDAWYTQYFGASKPKNAMRGIHSISGPPNRKTRCVVYAVFRALGTLRTCGSCHAGHIRRGRPSMHFLRVYAPAEPVTIIITAIAIAIVIVIIIVIVIVIVIVITIIVIIMLLFILL